jgi:hypothetical protein
MLRVDRAESAESFPARSKTVNVYECSQACAVPHDFVIPRKHRLEEQCVCIKFWFRMRKKYYKTLIMLKEIFGEETMGQIQVLDGSPNSKVVQPMPKIPNAQDVHRQTKQMKMWGKWRSLSWKTEESLSMKLLICLDLHTGQFRAFLKKIWTSIRLLPNVCPASFVWASTTGNKQNDCHPTLPPHKIYNSIIYFFPKIQEGIEVKEI